MGSSSILGRIWVLMFTVFMDMVGYLIVLPLLPFYAEKLGARDSIVGVLIATFAFAQLATAPFWGKLSDRYGRRPMILSGLAISAVAYILFGLATSVLLLLVSRLAQGAGGGLVGVVQAYVSDAVDVGERAKALGWLTAATSAGVMVGPALGLLAARFGPSAPGFVAAGLCLANLLFAWRYLPESAREHIEPLGPADPAAAGSLRHTAFALLRHPGAPVARLIWIYAVAMMAFMALNGVIALYLERVFGVTEKTIGFFYIYVGAVSLVMRALLLGPIVHRLGELRTLRVGVFAITLGLAAVPLATGFWSLAAVVVLIPIGTALLFPATTSLVSQNTERGRVGQMMGLQQFFGGLARVVGPLWAAAVFEHVSIRSPFWLASVVMAVVGLMAFRISAPKPAPELVVEDREMSSPIG